MSPEIEKVECEEVSSSKIPLHKDCKSNIKWIKEWHKINRKYFLINPRVFLSGSESELGSWILMFTFIPPKDWNGFSLSFPVEVNKPFDEFAKLIHAYADSFQRMKDKFYYDWFLKRLLKSKNEIKIDEEKPEIWENK